MRYRAIFFILAIFLVGCQSVTQNFNNDDLLNWKYSDLRLLDEIETIKPDQDLIAVYTRTYYQSFQIRLDFLDLDTYLGKDIYITLDTNPGCYIQYNYNQNVIFPNDIAWDYLIKITNSGDIGILDDKLSPLSDTELFIVYDFWQDRIVISFKKSVLPIYYGKTKMQVTITPTGQNIATDTSQPFFIDSSSPPRAKVIFAFWNTFSSVTPAQTLRSWAGAHVGPMSSRHGLRYLIDSAVKFKSPVLLLDLLTPENLSALDYLNVIPRIRSLSEQGILTLVDTRFFEIHGEDSNESNIGFIVDKNISFDMYKTWQINSGLIKTSNNNDFFLF